MEVRVKIVQYHIPLQSNFILPLATGAKILAVQNLGEVPTLIVQELDMSGYSIRDETERKFQLVSSNETFTMFNFHDECSKKYIGSFSLSGGARVFHLFEILN